MKKHKYVIYMPANKSCGGFIALRTLYKGLEQLEINVKTVTTFSVNATGKYKYIMPFYLFFYQIYYFFKNHRNEDYKSCRHKFFPFVGKNTIVVYPEIVNGNLLNAKNVVRWLLYHNKIYHRDENGNTIGYNKNDLFFAYRDVFNDPKLNPNCNLLKTPYYDLELYKRTNYGNRDGKCYIIRKGASRPDLPKEFDGVIIDYLPEKEKVDVFNKCEYCISYDTQTAYSSIAAMCGCISIVVPEHGKKRSDYLATGEKGFGIAYGYSKEEIDFATKTREKVLDNYKLLNNSSLNSIKKFVEICEEYFEIN